MGKFTDKICRSISRSIDRSVPVKVSRDRAHNRTVCVCARDPDSVFSQGHGPRVANCARHPRDENTVMVAAGASEQQKQHELKEESGFMGMGFKGEGEEGRGDRGAKREESRSKRDRRAAEEKIEGEIPSESSRCDPV